MRPAYHLISVRTASYFKQYIDTPARSRFYAQCRPVQKILSGNILRSFQRKPNFVRRRAA